MARASWDDYFMEIAEKVASRATCDRKQVGAVLARDLQVVSTGYNGSIRGLPHCDDMNHGHMIEESAGDVRALLASDDFRRRLIRKVEHVVTWRGSFTDVVTDLLPVLSDLIPMTPHCVRTVHAEANAISQAAKRGAACDQATLYVTTFPCWRCFQLVVNAGVVRIVWKDPYVDRIPDVVADAAFRAKVKLERIATTQEGPTP